MKGGKREDGLHDDKVGCIDQTVGRAKGESESEVAKCPYHTCANTLKPGRCDSCRRTYDCNDTAYTAVSVYQRTARERGEATMRHKHERTFVVLKSLSPAKQQGEVPRVSSSV